MGLFGKLFKSDFENLLESASYEELADEHETRRLEWLKQSSDDITNEMERLGNEMLRRSNEKYEKENPNAKTRHREHGWYLPNDD